MPSDLQRVAQALVECLDQIPTIVGSLQRRAAQLRQEASMIVDFRSDNPTARHTALQLDAAARACDEAAHLASMVPPKARAWAEQMVSGARTAERSDGRRNAASGGSGNGNGEGNRSRPSRQLPSLEDIMARFPRGGHRQKTRGIWRDADGNDNELASGRDDYESYAAAKFMKERKIGPPPHDTLMLDSHLEVKFAMHMRLRGLRDETIVINNPPCGGNNPDDGEDGHENGCRKNLKQFLQPGARLTVIAPGFKWTYVGGEDPES
jgi:hypothetical protein